jgi:hypothetical protein
VEPPAPSEDPPALSRVGRSQNRSDTTEPRKEDRMCLTCGCGELNDDHGDSRNITYDDLKAAAQAAEVSVDEAVKNFDETVKKAS